MIVDNRRLEALLQFYNCPCEVLDIRTGGGFCDYLLQPLKGTTIHKLQARANDFGAMLGESVQIALEQFDIIFRIKDDTQPQTFNFFDYSHQLTPEKGFIGIGANARGEYVEYNLFNMPHLLAAGATGSGKSVFLHDVIISLAINSSAYFRLIDLKRVELSIYNGCHFVDGAVITDADAAERALLEEVAEMQSRYALMERYGVRNYKDLPEKKKLCARVIVIDELADLMLNKDTRKSVENSIVRIAQLGRAAGVHLVLATQRPSTNVITGLIKANIPCKIAFMTANAVDSRVIGCKGAENLDGRGDALLSIAGQKELERVQTFYIDDDTLHGILDDVRQNGPRKPKKGLLQRIFGL